MSRQCSEEGCGKKIGLQNKSGMCRAHRWPEGRTCSVIDCEGKPFGRGYCSKHYNRWRKYGSPDVLIKVRGNDKLRISRYIEKTTTCWIWTGHLNANGYGSVRKDGPMALAHRVVYEMETGTTLGSRILDHICHNPACVNPDHLRIVTTKQNQEHLLGARSDSKTGVRGVWLDPKSKSQKYQAMVRHNGKGYSAGRFTSIEEAEEAVIELRLKLFTHNEIDKQARTTTNGETK